MVEIEPLGRLLREERIARGYSQASLAEQLGCSRTHVSQIEAGVRRPGYRLLARIAELTGIDLGRLAAAAAAVEAVAGG